MDEIELDDLDKNREEEERSEEMEETDFGGSYEGDSLDNLDWLANKGKPVTVIGKMFGGEENYYKVRCMGFLFDDVLLLEPECTNFRLTKWLMDEKGFKIKKKISQYGFLVDYEFSYDATEEDDRGNIWNITRIFKTADGDLVNPEDFAVARTDIREFYDYWRKQELNRILKRKRDWRPGLV